MDLFGLIYHGFALIILALGIFILYDNSRSKINWTFFLYAIGAFGWMLSLYWGYYFIESGNFELTLILFRLAYGFSILAMSMMTAFFYLFPRVTKQIWTPLIHLFLAVTIGLLIISVFSPYIHESLSVRNGIYLGDNFGFLYSVYSIHILLNLILSIFFSLNTHKRVHGIERSKIAYAIAGYIAFISLAIITNVILPVFDIFILQKEVPILSLLFIVPAFIAMYKYRFFHLSYFTFNILRRIILYTGFVLVAFLIFNGPVARESNTYFVIGILLALVFYEYIKNYIPSFKIGSQKELVKSLDEFHSNIYYADTYHKIKAVLDKIFVVKLHFVTAEIYVVRKGNTDMKMPIYVPNAFTQVLEGLKKDVLVLGEINYMRLDISTKKILHREMKTLGADICLPLSSENNLIGFFILKRKEENYNFAQEEIKELISTQAPLEIGLMNILLKMNLQEENDLMKKIIDKKTKELKKKIEEVNVLLKQQADFIAVTAHEFRTPLSIATFQIEDIMNSKNKPAQQLKDLKVVEDSIANVKTLTEKLFTVQQYDLNKVDLHIVKTNITDFIKHLFKDFTPIMKDRKLNFKLKLKNKKKLSAMVDQAQFRQVLHNLLTNASKFTPKAGNITLILADIKGKIVIRVEDSGDGIPKDMRKSIFEKFRTKNAGHGIGLGLYLCKKIIELHKGKLRVEDSELGGASFIIEISKLGK